MRKITVVLFLCFLGGSAHAKAQKWSGECGGTSFSVTVSNGGHPLDNTFVLSTFASNGFKEIYRAEEGGWFHAACTESKKGKPLLIFQSYCGGSHCIESKYGAVDPQTLKVLLLPSRKNISNAKKLEVLTGKPAIHLGEQKNAFCCEN